jgi:DNA-binding response OmpR family regulator
MRKRCAWPFGGSFEPYLIRVFTREELMRTVWGWEGEGGSLRTRTLDTHAARLRHKLSGGRTSFVINVWGVGYRLLDGVAS